MPEVADFPGKANQTAKKQRRPRYAFPGSVFFSVPTRFYDGGFAARLTPSDITRYLTLLRISNFDYGNEIVGMSARELGRLDGIAPRTARGIYTKLQELGLLKKGPGNGRAARLILVHPSDWRDENGPKARLIRFNGKVTCTPK